MKYVVYAFLLFIVGYAVLHRPPRGRSDGLDQRSSQSTSRHYAGRAIEDLREELGAREQMLAQIKHAMATGDVAKCARAGKVTFTEEAYETVRGLEREIATLREEIRARAN